VTVIVFTGTSDSLLYSSFIRLLLLVIVSKTIPFDLGSFSFSDWGIIESPLESKNP
jgi:hypothetical protein